MHKGNLPYINEEGIVEFPQIFTPVLQSKINPSKFEESEAQIETTAASPSKPFTFAFMESKRKEEEKKASMQ